MCTHRSSHSTQKGRETALGQLQRRLWIILLFKFSEKNYFVWSKELSRVFFGKYNYGAVFVPAGLRGYPRSSQAPWQPSGGWPISDVEAKRAVSSGGHHPLPPKSGAWPCLPTLGSGRDAECWLPLCKVGGIDFVMLEGREDNHGPISFHLRFASF